MNTIANTAVHSQTDPTDEALLTRVGAGDRDAFAILFRRLAPRVKAYLMGLGATESAADDLAQDAMVAMWRRAKSYDAAAQSDVRNLAEFQEMYLSDFGQYGTIAQIQASEPAMHVSKDVTLSVVLYDGVRGYCLSARHAGSSHTWLYDSQGGGLLPRGTAACPVTVTGTPGDTLLG